MSKPRATHRKAAVADGQRAPDFGAKTSGPGIDRFAHLGANPRGSRQVDPRARRRNPPRRQHEIEMSDLAAVDNGNGFPGPSQKRGRHRGFGVSVNLTHAKVAREKPPAKPAPIAPTAAIAPALALPSIEITGRALAKFENYDGLWNAIRARVEAMGITRIGIDTLSGIPDGYAGKLLGAAQIRKIGPNSLEKVLDGTGCYLVLVEDSAATEKLMAAAKKLHLFRRAAPRALKLLPPPSQALP